MFPILVTFGWLSNILLLPLHLLYFICDFLFKLYYRVKYNFSPPNTGFYTFKVDEIEDLEVLVSEVPITLGFPFNALKDLVVLCKNDNCYITPKYVEILKTKNTKTPEYMHCYMGLYFASVMSHLKKNIKMDPNEKSKLSTALVEHIVQQNPIFEIDKSFKNLFIEALTVHTFSTRNPLSRWFYTSTGIVAIYKKHLSNLFDKAVEEQKNNV